MTLLTWDEGLAVGIPSIDAQTRLLVESLNELHAAVMRGANRSQTGMFLRSFVTYVRGHFATEERIMARVNYPELPQHQALHRELLQGMEKHLARFERGESAISLETLNLLRDNLTQHIRKVDEGYRPWVMELDLE